MEFRVLGPLEVRRADHLLELGTGRQRALLALLIVRRREVVSIDRMVDELWGERPPPTAHKIVQNAMSALRRTLTDGGLLETHGHGYLLRVDDGCVDVERFDALVSDGRQHLASGEFELAASRLRAALDVWRGRALANVEGVPLVEAEAARLDERRVDALESRIDAELGLGRGVELVGELEGLVAAHPLRERFRAQLMRALYRSGRQADALAAYRAARRTLLDELGIEPGPELRSLESAVLRHDPALDPPSQTALPVGRTRASAVLLALAAVAITATALWAWRRDAEPKRFASAAPAVPVLADSVAVLDPATNRVVDDVPVGRSPGPIVVGEGAVWVANVGEATVSRIDPRARRVVATIGVGVEPSSLAVADGSVWVAGAGEAVLLKIDTNDNRVRARMVVPESIGPLPEGYDRGPSAVAARDDGVWLAHGEEVSRIDPATGRVVATIAAGGNWSGAIVADDRAVWVVENDRLQVRRRLPGFVTGVARIDPATNAVTATIPVGGLRVPTTSGTVEPDALALGEGALWAAATPLDLVWRLEVESGERVRTIGAGPDPAGVAVGEGAVWVENHSDGVVVRIDPFSNRRVATIPIGGSTRGIAVGEGAVWLTVVG